MENLEEYIEKHSRNKEKTSSFVEYLYSLMDKYGFENYFDIYIKDTLERITHNKKEDYSEYIKNCLRNPIYA